MADIDSILKKIVDDSSNGSGSWTPLQKIPLVQKEINALKDNIKIYVHDNNFDINSILEESNELVKESKLILNDLEVCKDEIKQETMVEVLKCIEKHDRIATELESVNFTINILFNVLQCGKFVKDFEDETVTHSYSTALESVYDLLQFVESPSEGFSQLDLFVNTKNAVQHILDGIIVNLCKEWDTRVTITQTAGTRESVVTLNLLLEESRFVLDVLYSLMKTDKLHEKLVEFSKTLMQDVLIPIMDYECTVVSENEDVITITIYHRQNRPSYNDVISNMKLLFQFLNNQFKIQYDVRKPLMEMVGEILSTEFCMAMMENCFIDTIPNTVNELKSYGRITSEIHEFQHFLKVIKFFPEEGISLLKYLENIDVLFAQRSSKYFLESARAILIKDLSATMSIGVEKIPDVEPTNASSEESGVAEALQIFDKTIPKSLFYFPRCMISKTAQELLDLVYVIMEQAVQCSDIVCRKLYVTTRLIFELYDAVVPYHHEKYLQTIPQYVALFHNNCMYLAHNLLTLGNKWLSLMEGRELDYVIGFVDLVPKMRELGYKHLTIHMQQQRKQILDNIRSSDLNCIIVKDVLGENAEAAVRQCLRQLQLLKNVWIGVFPNNVFTRLMATLTNMFIDELIHRVCTVEDISMEMATQLNEMYTIVIQKTPSLFHDPEDVDQYVKSWSKLRELIFVLGGSLKDIERQWDEGAGPLAVHLSTHELRNLIKALFQNTQFRANLLAKIK